MNNNLPLIEVKAVSKIFCRDLKLSLFYGIKDILKAILKTGPKKRILRKKEFYSVNHISFELKRGDCLGLIGHNGAGKSTLLKMLNGLIKPDNGEIVMRGKIGALIELGAGFNPILTGRENIYNNGSVLGFSRKEIDNKIDEIIEFSEMGEFIDAPVQNYSSGMKVRLGFAVAAQMEPDILLIDEVLAVGDLGFIIKGLNRMSELLPNTATIFVTHSMPMMARICNKVLLMDKGKAKFLSNDITEGIKQYIELFQSPERMNQGSNLNKLTRIAIKNPATGNYEESQSISLHTFDDLELEVEVQVSNKISSFDLFLTTFDGQLREVMSSRSEINCEAFGNQGETLKTYHIKVPQLTLATGKYSVTFGATDPLTKQFYCRVTNSTFFHMSAVGNTWASSLVPGTWTETKSISA